jgi:secondary thiamine-phosphate synthase enzyme
VTAGESLAETYTRWPPEATASDRAWAIEDALECGHMHRLTIKTNRKREILDITDRVETLLSDHYGGQLGVCHLVVLHTTAALATADLDPGTDTDMLDAFERIIPKLKYRHPHDPEHVPDHILSAIIGTSVGLLAEKGSLVLGTWQRVILIELDGPRQREIAVGFFVGV